MQAVYGIVGKAVCVPFEFLREAFTEKFGQRQDVARAFRQRGLPDLELAEAVVEVFPKLSFFNRQMCIIDRLRDVWSPQTVR